MSIPIRTIGEEVSQLLLERNIRIVYVEGAFDKAVLNDFFSIWEHDDVIVKEISEVAVNVLSGGNRARVIKLSEEMAVELPADNDKVRCVADADFEGLTGVKTTNRYLLYTDYASMDLYFFQRSCVQQLVRILYKKPYKASYFNSIVECLQFTFAFRMAKSRMDLGIRVLSAKSSCNFSNDEVEIIESDYLIAQLRTRGLNSEIPAVKREMVKVRKLFATDSRMQIHSKDLLVVLSFLGKKLGVKSETTVQEVIQSTLVVSSDWTSVGNNQLFLELDAWAS